MTAYYNDNDPFVCAWLRELIKEGHISPGDVDERPIQDIDPADLRGYTRCHFFAGIGGWDLALQLAGWPDDRPVWTGSCPCQPFSNAGKREGFDDERHLWPSFFALISELRPPTVFGEQVGGPAGCEWLARVFDDLDGIGYRVAGADLPACCVGAPHIRQRLFWVGNAERSGLEGHAGHGDPHGRSGQAGSVAQTGRVRCVEPTRDGGEREVWRRAPAEPALFPVADGIPNRVGILRGAGNAIVPQVAAEFIGAYLECE